MHLNIDLRPRKSWPQGIQAWLLGIACLFTLDAAWLFYQEIEQQRALEARLAGQKQQARQTPLPFAKKKIDAINRGIQQLNLPWHALLFAVENSLSDKVTLLLLEPDATRQILRIQGEAKSASDMLAFVETLGKEHLFTRVSLTHHEINDNDTNKPYRFSIEAQWLLPS